MPRSRMIRITQIFITLSLLLPTSLRANQQIAGQQIVSGDMVTDIMETNFAVNFGHSCAGSIISEKWILSAAHCAQVIKNLGIASIGALNVNDNSVIDVEIKNVLEHPAYSPSTFENDFSLVELKKPLALNGHTIDKIEFASQKHVLKGIQKVGKTVTIYGWGRTGEWNSSSDDILRVEVPIVSNAVANEAVSYSGAVKPSMLAAGFKEGKKDACQGDSGGPLVSFNKANKRVLIGVVSWGQGCARENKYGVYSRISHVSKWIKETIK